MKTRIASFVPAILIFCFVFATASIARAQSNPVPFVNTPLVPASAAPGGPGFTLTVNGTGFVSGSVVNWNGSPRSTTFVGSTQLTAAITAADAAVGQTTTVTVGNPGVAELSPPVLFQVMPPESTLSLNTTTTTIASGQSLSLFQTVADFNGDGKPDIAVVEPTSAQVIIFLGNGDGTFVEQPPLVVNFEPLFIKAGDVNGDGKADLLLNQFVLLGNGDGTFQQPIAATGFDPVDAVLGDFNGDGKMDIAYGIGRGFYVIALGNGDGTFVALPPSNALSGSVTGVTAGDFNRDGKLDLAFSILQSQTDIVFGNGDGTFGPQSVYNVDPGLSTVAITSADFNGDGILDLAVLNTPCPNDGCSPPGTMSILLGNADGTFQPPLDNQLTGIEPSGLAVGDFNGDGKVDLAVNVYTNDSIFLGNGDGTFSEFDFVFPLPPVGLLAADFNGDGLLDLVTTSVGNLGLQIGVALQLPITPSLAKVSFPPQLVGTTSVPHPVTLKNTGKTTIPLSGVKINGPGSFSQTNTCGTTLAPGHSCNTKLTFAPTTVGAGTAFVSVTNTPGATVNLSGVGTALKVSPVALNFGNVPVGKTSSPITVTLSNVSSAPISISGLAVHGTNSNEFRESNTCGRSLAGNASCTVTVTFRPTAKGAQKAFITITDSDPASPQKVGLAGTGK